MHHIHGMVRVKLQLWKVCLRFEFRPSQVEIMNGHGKHVEIRLVHHPALALVVSLWCSSDISSETW